MKKILSIVSGNPSGSLNIAIDISNYLKTKGYEVIDIFRKYNNTDLKGIIVIKDKFTKCERKAPKFIYGDISSLKNNDSISLFFIVLYF